MDMRRAQHRLQCSIVLTIAPRKAVRACMPAGMMHPSGVCTSKRITDMQTRASVCRKEGRLSNPKQATCTQVQHCAQSVLVLHPGGFPPFPSPRRFLTAEHPSKHRVLHPAYSTQHTALHSHQASVRLPQHSGLHAHPGAAQGLRACVSAQDTQHHTPLAPLRPAQRANSLATTSNMMAAVHPTLCAAQQKSTIKPRQPSSLSKQTG